MDRISCSGGKAGSNELNGLGHETVYIPKTRNACDLCEDYAESQSAKPVVVMSCEGACLRGEIARRAANYLCFELAREDTARLCLGGAFTKNTGQRNMARHARRLVALEGCPIRCAARMMHGVLEGREAEVFVTDAMFDFDRSLFGIDEMPEDEIKANAMIVARKIAEALRGQGPSTRKACCG